ncbi:uncharacterized protein THITE_2123435 [Thermothielavioides terrestris NRRL 8126]|uniref:diphosphoinositol-polyphosphate diphosphatase n=1 Tax=Thermothielavioides terrestris (strain ATCC 38088 / NRRL 8126) TaxID=578455 RepID=G2RHD5_THETT|nr:uncharacterized protein THITE_2123435 [Thermothielavioides terrestris NRRL 8126]AEO71247.1 hypothetical protein THITE_2123435 [Thermothielavioides terrestris NRRL 8126]
MPVGDNALVSKRSGRPYDHDGVREEAKGYRTRQVSGRDEAEMELWDRQSLSSTATTWSRQSSLGPSPTVSSADEEQEAENRISGGQGGPLSDPRLAGAFQPSTAPLDSLAIGPEERISAGGRPANFGVVVPGVYRSSFPQVEDYAFIEGLQLKTIITLVRKDFPRGYDAFLHKNGIRHYVFDMKGTKKEDIPITTMRSILRLVLDRRNHPLLIHCNHGKHRTGCVIGVVRKLSGWALTDIISEYEAYAEPKARACDIKYITGFELANISSLSREAASSPFRSFAFLRASIFALVMLAVWLVSGSRIAAARGAPPPQRKPPGEAGRGI